MNTNLLLPEKTEDLTPVQKGWLKLSNLKTNCFDNLQKKELAVQKILNGFDDMELSALQIAIKSAKEEAGISKEMRLEFTRMIDEKLIKPAMLFEGRNDELIKKAVNVELDKRKAEAAKADKIRLYNAEILAFDAHLKNEYTRIETNYKNALQNAALEMYQAALKAKINPDEIGEYLDKCCAHIKSIPVEKINKFNLVLLEKDKALAQFNSVEKYNHEKDLEIFLDDFLNNTFGMYAFDLKNIEAATLQFVKATAEKVQENNNVMEVEVAANNLVASAVEVVADGHISIKKEYKIITEDTEEFAMKVLAVFIKNWPQASKKIGVKSWIKLVDPFVKALDKLDTEFTTFKYEEIIK